MKKNTQTFEIDISNDDILDRAMDILESDSKALKNFMDRYDDAIKEYAKKNLDMIDVDEASEHCGMEHVVKLQ